MFENKMFRKDHLTVMQSGKNDADSAWKWLFCWLISKKLSWWKYKGFSSTPLRIHN